MRGTQFSWSSVIIHEKKETSLSTQEGICHVGFYLGNSDHTQEKIIYSWRVKLPSSYLKLLESWAVGGQRILWWSVIVFSLVNLTPDYLGFLRLKEATESILRTWKSVSWSVFQEPGYRDDPGPLASPLGTVLYTTPLLPLLPEGGALAVQVFSLPVTQRQKWNQILSWNLYSPSCLSLKKVPDNSYGEWLCLEHETAHHLNFCLFFFPGLFKERDNI